ncbi:beta-galactosidase domain 4-containing protein [Streptomyces swartbergensis]|uniref:beta-galactosidase domain 4-containing protein n=1 Tax=Streptomyces swartbergensis TaxID=487165 RepID=UPI003827AD54
MSERLALRIRNDFDFLDTSCLAFDWRLEVDGALVADGVLDLPPIAARTSHEVSLDEPVTTAPSAGGEHVLTVRALFAKDHNGVPAGHEIAFTQLVLPTHEEPRRDPVPVRPERTAGRWYWARQSSPPTATSADSVTWRWRLPGSMEPAHDGTELLRSVLTGRYAAVDPADGRVTVTADTPEAAEHWQRAVLRDGTAEAADV